MDSSMAIHGGAIFNKAPALEGILDTLQCKLNRGCCQKNYFSRDSFK